MNVLYLVRTTCSIPTCHWVESSNTAAISARTEVSVWYSTININILRFTLRVWVLNSTADTINEKPSATSTEYWSAEKRLQSMKSQNSDNIGTLGHYWKNDCSREWKAEVPTLGHRTRQPFRGRPMKYNYLLYPCAWWGTRYASLCIYIGTIYSSNKRCHLLLYYCCSRQVDARSMNVVCDGL